MFAPGKMDRLFWTALRSVWSRWAEVRLIVKPETVVSWHRAGFRLYWRWRSRGPVPGRDTITAEIQELIRRIARENPSWGAPKIHGELLKLGFVLSERSVSRYDYGGRTNSGRLHRLLSMGMHGASWIGLAKTKRSRRECTGGGPNRRPSRSEERKLAESVPATVCLSTYMSQK